MVTLWIGDLRTKQLQKVYKTADLAAEYHYIADDLAEYTWFRDNIVSQFPLLSLENANIVIMLGFIDCLYSCVWDVFEADKIAEQYANTINTLITNYPNFYFYVCPVSPVNADYPFAEGENAKITRQQLSDKIDVFNNVLKGKCLANYIDSYDYLVNTGFETRDGVRFTYDTCTALHNYINATVEERFTLDNFKLDSITPTEVEASFIIRNGIDCYYILTDEADNELLKEPLILNSEAGALQIVSFKCSEKTIPNTTYTLKVQATEVAGEDTLTRSITFTTPQDYPTSAESIEFSCADELISVNSLFELTVEMPTSLGYWGMNNYGYEELLIVNGKEVRTKIIENTENITAKKFTIEDEFGYACKIDDIIQIGIRIWTTDNAARKIYDLAEAKVSEPICLLNKPIAVYINK